MIALGMDFDTKIRQAILQTADRNFITGNDTRGEDTGVAFLQLDQRMIAIGDTRKCRAGFTLRTGAEIEHLIGFQVLSFAFADRVRNTSQQADMTRGGGDTVHRAPDQTDLAAGFHGGAHDGIDPRHVRGETGDGNALFKPLDNLGQFDAHIVFRTGPAFDEHIGRIADHGQQAFVAQLANGRNVCGRASDRRLVEFPVAGMENRAQFSADRQAIRFGDRVSKCNIINIERTKLHIAVERHFGHITVIDPSLTQLFAHKVGGEWSRKYRCLDLIPQPAERADMVFVGVRQDDTENVLANQELRIRHDHLDTGRRQVTEGHPDIDNNPLTIIGRTEPIQVQVHADFVRSAKRQEHQFVFMLFHFYSYANQDAADCASVRL